MAKPYYAILLTLFIFSCKQEKKFYHGKVLDENNQPMSAVIVKELDGKDSVLTMDDGYFQLAKKPDRIDDLVFRKDGFQTDTIPSVSSHAGEQLFYMFLQDSPSLVVMRPLSNTNKSDIKKDISSNADKIFKDTFQYIGVGENEDNTYLMFLDKKKDTANIVFQDDIEIDCFQNKMVEIEWYWRKMTSGGDSEIQYEQAFESKYRFVPIKRYR